MQRDEQVGRSKGIRMPKIASRDIPVTEGDLDGNAATVLNKSDRWQWSRRT